MENFEQIRGLEVLDTLKNLNLNNYGSGRQIWNFVDKDDNLCSLELYLGKLYLNRGYRKNGAYITINEIDSDLKNDLQRSDDILSQNKTWKTQITDLIGSTTFYTRCISGWNIQNSKIKLKITMENFKSIDKKTIRLQYTLNSKTESKDILTTGKQVLIFVKKHENLITLKECDLDNVNKKNINKNDENNVDNTDTNTNNTNTDNIYFNKNKLTKEQLDKIKQVLYIRLPKDRRISYQSCLPYNEDKQRLEKIMGINLDL